MKKIYEDLIGFYNHLVDRGRERNGEMQGFKRISNDLRGFRRIQKDLRRFYHHLVGRGRGRGRHVRILKDL